MNVLLMTLTDVFWTLIWRNLWVTSFSMPTKCSSSAELISNMLFQVLNASIWNSSMLKLIRYPYSPTQLFSACTAMQKSSISATLSKNYGKILFLCRPAMEEKVVKEWIAKNSSQRWLQISKKSCQKNSTFSTLRKNSTRHHPPRLYFSRNLSALICY